MTNLPSTSATRVSTSLRHQWAMAGQARLASARGRKRTATYTAAARIRSSTHTARAPTTTARPPTNITNAGADGSVALVIVSPLVTAARKCPPSRPDPWAMALLMASVTASPIWTSFTATAVNRIESGTLTSTDRTSVDPLCR